LRYAILLGLAFALLQAPKTASTIQCVAGCTGGASLLEPFGVAFDRLNNFYICEYKGQRISKVDPRGTISAFAGSDAGFHDPHGLVISKDQMYVADTLNNRVIRIDLKTGRAQPFAGTGEPGYSGDGGPALKASFNQVFALDINRAGDKVYLTDLRNRRIRSIDINSGIVATIAGNGQTGVPVDGTSALNSPLVDPRAAAVDSKGNLYILERNGNALRLVDTSGKIRTVIGPEKPPQYRNARERDLNGPKHLCIDSEDNVFIADTENNIIRKYFPRTGTTATIAGNGEKGDRLIQNNPLMSQLNRPHGVIQHSSGDLYISDSENNRILRLSGW